jgi:cobalt-zinc-cadmium efflux system protein
MEAAPSNINLYELIDEMKNRFDEIIEIHDIHVWSLSSEDIYFTGHIVVKDMDRSMEVLEKLEKFLKEKGITHSTIQIESIDKICEIFH